MVLSGLRASLACGHHSGSPSMKRRRILETIALGALAAPLAPFGCLGLSRDALAQQPETVKPIGVLLQGAGTQPQSARDELRVLG